LSARLKKGRKEGSKIQAKRMCGGGVCGGTCLRAVAKTIGTVGGNGDSNLQIKSHTRSKSSPQKEKRTKDQSQRGGEAKS